MREFNSIMTRRGFMKTGVATAIGLTISPDEIIKTGNSSMRKVYLTENGINGVNTLTQAMITQANTVYVVQYDFVLSGVIKIPENCILEFEGGSLTGDSIYLSKDVTIENGLINLSGQLHLNLNARLERCRIVRTTNMNSNDSVIIVKNEELDYTEVNVNIKIKDCIIEYVLGRKHALPRKGYAIELFSKPLRGNQNKGFSNLSFDNVLIDGYFNSAFYIHATESGWITDVLCNYIIITRAHNAFVLYSDYKTNSRIQAIRITNSSIQGMTGEDGYFLDCCNARGIYVYGSIPWDWNDYVHHSAFKFYSNTGYVYIDSIIGGNKDYDFVDLTGRGKTRNELIHIHSTSDYDLVNPSGYHINGNGNYLGDMIDLSKDVKMSEFIQLPEGVYYLPETHDVAQHLGLGGAQGGVLISRSEYNTKLIVYIGNVNDEQKRREIALMSLLTNQTFSNDAYVKDYWIRPVLLENKDSFDNINVKISQYDSTTYLKTTPVPQRSMAYNRYPKDLDNKWIGEHLYDSVDKRPVYWSGSAWMDSDGYSYNTKHGSTSIRESLVLNGRDAGFCFYDTDINMPVWWNGRKWKTADGKDV